MQQTKLDLMSMKERIVRILSNLAFLVGEWLSKGLGPFTSIREIVEKFILGWTEACVQTE